MYKKKQINKKRRKYMTICTNKKKLPISRIFSLLFLCSLSSYLYAGLVELELIHILNGTRIIFASDDHTILNEPEIDSFVTSIEAHDTKINAYPITLLVEQRLDSEYTCTYTQHMLISLLKRLEKQALRNTTIENVEIRTSANAAAALINPEDDILWSITDNSFFQNGTAEPLYVNRFIFEHIYNEFNQYKNYFNTRYKEYSQETIKQFFNERTQTADNQFSYLQELFNAYATKYAFNARDTVVRIVEKLKKVHNPEEAYIQRDILMRAVIRAFIPLFDLHAFDRIMYYATRTPTILFVSGFLHTQAVKKALLTLNGNVIKTASTQIMHELQMMLSMQS
jgi:hypothetical protein